MTSTASRTVHALAAHRPGLEVAPFAYTSRLLGDEDVEIAITHCGICGSDLHTITGGWGTENFPVVPGHEIVGHVTAVGVAVVRHAVGDRVGVGAQVWACRKKSCKQCAANKDSYCPHMVQTYDDRYADDAVTYGGYADYIRVSSHYAFKIPEAIPSEVAAPLLCAGVTVFAPLKKYVKAGDRVGVVGIGGLGHLALQFIAALDATPVAFSQSPNKEAEVRALGAADFVNTRDSGAVARASRSLQVLLVTADAKGQPYDTYLNILGVGGTLIMVGAPDDKMVFCPRNLFKANISVVGSLIGGQQDIEDMLALAAANKVFPVTQTLPMTAANEGIKMVHEGRARYRVVLENGADPRL